MVELNRQEQSLLLYLETCTVDNQCFVDLEKVNKEDIDLLQKFQDNGLISYGRYSMKSVFGIKLGYWVYLTDAGFELAHTLRKERAKRAYDKLKLE